MIAEFALALPLLAGAGLTIHSFWNLTHVDLGVRTDHILGFYLVPRAAAEGSYSRSIHTIGVFLPASKRFPASPMCAR